MIGTLRTLATLEAKTQVDDGGGGFSESWSTLATVWCAVELLTGAETVSGDQVTAFKRVRIRLRFRDDVTETLRLRVDQRLFNIEAVNDPDSRRRWLDLVCVENAPS